MSRRDVSEADVQARLARLQSGQPWSGMGALVTVLAGMILLGEGWLKARGFSAELRYGGVICLLLAGGVLQYLGWRKRKAFAEQSGAGR